MNQLAALKVSGSTITRLSYRVREYDLRDPRFRVRRRRTTRVLVAWSIAGACADAGVSARGAGIDQPVAELPCGAVLAPGLRRPRVQPLRTWQVECVNGTEKDHVHARRSGEHSAPPRRYFRD